MAGGGLKSGFVYGATDDVGMRSVENVTEVFDLHATILRLLGLDHKKLTYRFGGRDVSLTDIHGNIISWYSCLSCPEIRRRPRVRRRRTVGLLHASVLSILPYIGTRNSNALTLLTASG